MIANAVTVTDASFDAEVEQSKGLTLVDFSATWCPPCRLLEPILDDIAAERRGEVKVATVDSDANIRTTTRFNVRSVPTLLLFNDGRLVDRIVGVVPKARLDALITKYASIDRHVGLA